MSRRPQGTGSVTERPAGSGKWRLRVLTGRDPITGDWQRATRTVTARTKKEAQAQLSEFITELASSPATGGGATVATLLDRWHAQATARGLSPRTLDDGRQSIDKVIVPELGAIAVSALGPEHIDEWTRKLLTGEGRSRPLKLSSVRRHRAVLSSALSDAVRWKWIPANPVAQAQKLALPPANLQIPSAADVGRLIAKATEIDLRWGMLLRLAVVTGARRGELCALRWPDVEGGRIRFARSLYKVAGSAGEKAPKSGRVREMPIAPGAKLLLDGWRAEVERRAEAAEVTVAADGFIFSPWPDGSRPTNPDTVSSNVGRWCEELGIPHVHLHSLRHFAATELLGAGVAPQDVAELLGHANSAITLRVYAHATSDRQLAAANVLAGLMPAESAIN